LGVFVGIAHGYSEMGGRVKCGDAG
jgi:hypothetical protein